MTPDETDPNRRRSCEERTLRVPISERNEIRSLRHDVNQLRADMGAIRKVRDDVDDVRQIVDVLSSRVGTIQRNDQAAAERRLRWKRVMLVGSFCSALFGTGALVGHFAETAKAAPPPNAAAPLAWPTRSVEAAAHRWMDELAPDALGDGVRLVTHEWACSRTKRRPARYRCEGAALWIEAGEYVETREVLSACRPSRRVTGNGTTWTSARVLVRREGPRRGGLLCRRTST